MLVGTRWVNQPTTMSDLARLARVYQLLKDYHGVKYNYNESQVYDDIVRLFNRLYNGSSWHYPPMTDFIEDDMETSDLCTWVDVTQKDYTSSSIKDQLSDIVWTFHCITGYMLHDASVSYIETNGQLAWDIMQLKLTWETGILKKALYAKNDENRKYKAFIEKYYEDTFFTQNGDVFELT